MDTDSFERQREREGGGRVGGGRMGERERERERAGPDLGGGGFPGFRKPPPPTLCMYLL